MLTALLVTFCKALSKAYWSACYEFTFLYLEDIFWLLCFIYFYRLFNIQTFKSDVFKFLEKYTGKNTIIFADPPYDIGEGNFAKIPDLVFERDLLEEDGFLIIEHAKHTDLSELKNFSFSKKYGGSVFSFFEQELNEESEDQ